MRTKLKAAKQPGGPSYLRTFLLCPVLFVLLIAAGASSQNTNAVPDAKTFFEQVNLDYPGLESIKKLVQQGDYTRAAGEYVKFVQNRTAPKFFIHPQQKDSIIAGLNRYHPEHKMATLTEAQSTVDYTFDFQGYKKVFKPGQMVWEGEPAIWYYVLNRMEYLQPLGLAYWYTGDPRYAKVFVEIIDDWIKNNPIPAPSGGNYADDKPPQYRAFDVGARARHWIYAYMYFMHAPEFTAEKQFAYFRRGMEQGNYIAKYFVGGGFNNWKVNSGSGEFLWNFMFPEWKNTAEWMKDQKYILENAVLEYTNEDGFQSELSMGYHKGVSDKTAQIQYLLKNLNNMPGFSSQCLERLEKSYEVVKHLKKPDGEDPKIGDGHLDLPPENTSKYKPDQFFTYPALLFGDAEFKSLGPSVLGSDMYLKLGQEAFNSYATIENNPAQLNSIFLPSTQLAVMRSGTGVDTNSLYSMFDNSIWGNGGHSHHDYLSLNLHAYGKHLLIDPGTGISYSFTEHWDYFKTVAAHNTIQVGDDPKDTYRATDTSKIYNDVWSSNTKFDFARGILKNYNKTQITREVFFVKGEYWFVRDKVTGTGSPAIKQYWHMWPVQVATNNVSKSAISQSSVSANLSIVPLLKEEMTFALEDGMVAGDKEFIKSPNITYTKNKSLPVTFELVLYPTKTGETIALQVDNNPISGKGNIDNSVSALVHIGEDKKDYFYVSEENSDVTFNNGGKVKMGTALVRENAQGVYHVALQGTKIGHDKFQLELPQSGSAYLDIEGSGAYHFYSDVSNARVTVPQVNPGQTISYQTGLDWAPLSWEEDTKNKTISATIPVKGHVQLKLDLSGYVNNRSKEFNRPTVQLQQNGNLYTILMDRPRSVQLALFSIDGTMVMDRRVTGQWINLPLTKFARGMYLLKIIGTDFNYQKHLTKF